MGALHCCAARSDGYFYVEARSDDRLFIPKADCAFNPYVHWPTRLCPGAWLMLLQTAGSISHTHLQCLLATVARDVHQFQKPVSERWTILNAGNVNVGACASRMQVGSTSTCMGSGAPPSRPSRGGTGSSSSGGSAGRLTQVRTRPPSGQRLCTILYVYIQSCTFKIPCCYLSPCYSRSY